jgi:hypothetical protein
VSNTPVQFKRKKKAKGDPHRLDIDGEIFLFSPKLGSKALEPIGRLESDGVAAMFQAIGALMVERPTEKQPGDGEEVLESEGTSFARFVALDLDSEEELPKVFELIFGLYNVTPGESQASSTSSDDDEANSSPTSVASTAASTSKRLKSA